MKKFLAIVLSIMMVLGACGVSAFAFDEAELPVMPTQTENYIYFAAGHSRGTVGSTYDIPIYMISDYPTEIDEGIVQLGFQFYVPSECQYLEINSVEFADEIKAIDGFYGIEAHYGYTADEIDNGETYHTETDMGYVAFAAGLDALNQAKVQVATINVTVNEKFPGGAEYVEGSPDYAKIEFMPYNFFENSTGFCFFGDEDAYTGGIVAGTYTEDDFLTNEFITPDEAILEGTYDSDGGIYYSFGFVYLYVAPEVPSWTDKLLDWFKAQVEGILQIFETVHEYIRLVLNLI